MVTVGTSSIKVLDRNPNRVYVLLVNAGSTTLYVRFGNNAATSDTPLSANGGTWEIPDSLFAKLSTKDEFFLNLNAISSATGGDLRVVEKVK